MQRLQRNIPIVVVALLLGVAAWGDTPTRQSQVFQKTSSGGIQQVTANDPKDQALIAAIRADLEKQADRFGAGDYSGSLAAKYLAKLKPGEIAIVYRNVGNGAAVDYTGKDAAALDAIHAWLDAEIDAESD